MLADYIVNENVACHFADAAYDDFYETNARVEAFKAKVAERGLSFPEPKAKGFDTWARVT